MLKFVNFFDAQIQTELSDVGLTVELTAADLAKLPTLGAGEFVKAAVFDGSQAPEIVHITAVGVSSITLTRAQENTVARTWNVGSKIRAVVTKGVLEDLDTVALADLTDTASSIAKTAGNVLVADGAVFASVPISGDVSLTASGNLQLNAEVVGTTELATNAVSTAKLQDNAVTFDKLADNAGVGLLGFNATGVPTKYTALPANFVDTQAIANGAVTKDKLATGTANTALFYNNIGAVDEYAAEAPIKFNATGKSVGLNFATASQAAVGTDTTLPVNSAGVKAAIQAQVILPNPWEFSDKITVGAETEVLDAVTVLHEGVKVLRMSDTVAVAIFCTSGPNIVAQAIEIDPVTNTIAGQGSAVTMLATSTDFTTGNQANWGGCKLNSTTFCAWIKDTNGNGKLAIKAATVDLGTLVIGTPGTRVDITAGTGVMRGGYVERVADNKLLVLYADTTGGTDDLDGRHVTWSGTTGTAGSETNIAARTLADAQTQMPIVVDESVDRAYVFYPSGSGALYGFLVDTSGTNPAIASEANTSGDNMSFTAGSVDSTQRRSIVPLDSAEAGYGLFVVNTGTPVTGSYDETGTVFSCIPNKPQGQGHGFYVSGLWQPSNTGGAGIMAACKHPTQPLVVIGTSASPARVFVFRTYVFQNGMLTPRDGSFMLEHSDNASRRGGAVFMDADHILFVYTDTSQDLRARVITAIN